MSVNWGEVNLPTAALLILGYVAVRLAENYWNGKKTEKAESKESPTVPAEVFAKIVAAAVAEAVRPLKEVIENNTEALNAVQIQMAKQNGKLEHVLSNTNLLLQRDHHGGSS